MRLLTETKEVEVNGVQFTIGTVPRRVWLEIQARQMCAMRMYKMGSILAAAGENVNPADLTRKAIEALSPEELLSAETQLIGVHWDAIKYGVKGHKSEIPFIKDDLGCVADETISLYEINGFFTRLAQEVMAFNTASQGDKKN